MAALVAALSSFANADTIQFVGVPTGVNDGHYFVMPYQISIDGIPELVTCYDIYDDVNFGDTWDADLLSLGQAASSGFFSANPDALAKYERVAWLDSQTYQNTTEQIGLQYAIWSVFGTASSTDESLNYEAAADAAAASGYQGFNFGNVRFIEQIGGVVGQDGTKQAFVWWDLNNSGTRSLSRINGNSIAIATPEPESGLLLCLGLGCVLIGGLGRWMRRRARGSVGHRIDDIVDPDANSEG